MGDASGGRPVPGVQPTETCDDPRWLTLAGLVAGRPDDSVDHLHHLLARVRDLLAVVEVRLEREPAQGSATGQRRDSALSSGPTSGPTSGTPLAVVEIDALPLLVSGAKWGRLVVLDAVEAPRTEVDRAWTAAAACQLGAALEAAAHRRSVQQLATTDALTELPNRAAFEKRATRLLAFADHDCPVVLAILDVNEFMRFNEVHGHRAGDRLLVGIGELCREVTGELPGSMAARLSGDEFCVLTDEHLLADVLAALTRLLARCASDLSVTLACGVAQHSDEEPVPDLSALLGLADAAQFRAKRSRAATPVLANAADRAARRLSPALANGERGRSLAPVTQLHRRREFRDRTDDSPS